MSIVSDSAQVATAPVLRTLLSGVLDYAGLFPPAELPIGEAVDHFAASCEGSKSWMLGRFIVPVARLPQFVAVHAKLSISAKRTWRLSALLGSDPVADMKSVHEFNARQTGAEIVAVEAKAGSHAEISQLVKLVPGTLDLWVEVPGAPSLLVHELAAPHRGAKIRLGGMTASAFPSPMHVASFMRACHDARVAFKATAGLHHPIGGTYPISRRDPGVTVRMFGFLNVLLAATHIDRGGSVGDAVAILTEKEWNDFRLSGDSIGCRDRWFSESEIAAGRKFMRSFGSCSFLEPLDGLHQMQWL